VANPEGPGRAAAAVWHYTVVERLQHIFQAGELRPEREGIPRKEKAAVWFSANPVWEPTANRVIRNAAGVRARLTKDQTIVLGGGLARIGVAAAVAPVDWKAFKKQSGISPDRARAIYEEAIGIGARPAEWFATFEPVPRSQWLSVEVWENERWMPR